MDSVRKPWRIPPEEAILAQGVTEDLRHVQWRACGMCGSRMPCNDIDRHGSAEGLTLIRAIEYTPTDPEVLRLTDPTRYEQSFAHTSSPF
jgi:hypothetical protein